MRSRKQKYQVNRQRGPVEVLTGGNGGRALLLYFAFMAILTMALPVNAGYISPGTESGVSCTNTAAFATYNDCVGQVTDPKNEADGNPTTLVNYLNGDAIDKDGNLGFLGFDDESTPWGIQGDWLSISNQLNAPGELPGTSTDGFFTVTGSDRLSGGWTFDLVDTYIEYLVVTVKDGAGWSGYYYDLTLSEVSSYSSTWDTKGITDGSGKIGPQVSHMFAAYIPGSDAPPTPDPGPDPEPVPLPGTLLLLGLGLALGAKMRKKC